MEKMDRSDVNRRSFVKACSAVATLAAASATRLVQPAFALADAPKIKLVDKAGKPIKTGELKVNVNYIFVYPYVSTPCLLLRLDAPTPRNVVRTNAEKAPYTWPGGVGKDGAVVAYSAICSHLLTYDSRHSSFLTYHRGRSDLSEHERAITCCAHASTYDPTNGAANLSGPAEFPLAAVQLAYDGNSDQLTAVGFVGTVLFEKFFEAYRADLNADFGRGAYRELQKDPTIVRPIAEYSAEVDAC